MSFVMSSNRPHIAMAICRSLSHGTTRASGGGRGAYRCGALDKAECRSHGGFDTRKGADEIDCGIQALEVRLDRTQSSPNQRLSFVIVVGFVELLEEASNRVMLFELCPLITVE